MMVCEIKAAYKGLKWNLHVYLRIRMRLHKAEPPLLFFIIGRLTGSYIPRFRIFEKAHELTQVAMTNVPVHRVFGENMLTILTDFKKNWRGMSTSSLITRESYTATWSIYDPSLR